MYTYTRQNFICALLSAVLPFIVNKRNSTKILMYLYKCALRRSCTLPIVTLTSLHTHLMHTHLTPTHSPHCTLTSLHTHLTPPTHLTAHSPHCTLTSLPLTSPHTHLTAHSQCTMDSNSCTCPCCQAVGFSGNCSLNTHTHIHTQTMYSWVVTFFQTCVELLPLATL